MTSSYFYDHEHDDDLDRFWKKKKSGSFYDRDYDIDLHRFWKKKRDRNNVVEFSSSSEKKNSTTISSLFYDHDHDDDLDGFWKKKKRGRNNVAAVAVAAAAATAAGIVLAPATTTGVRLQFSPSLERLLYLLKQLGYSRNDINEALLEVEKIRKHRLTTRGRGRYLVFQDSVRSFFLTKYNQKARMIINRAVHAPLHHDEF